LFGDVGSMSGLAESGRRSAHCDVAKVPKRAAASDGAQRLLKRKEGGMAGSPCPAMTLASGPRTAAIKLY